MRYIIDRISGELVICENEEGDTVKLNPSELPKGAKEGDLLFKEGDAWYIDEKESSKRRRIMADKLNRLIE